jgi:gas vesicle protein
MRNNDVQHYDTYSYETNGGSMGRVFTGLLIGGLIGAAVGFLMAPVAGEELRRTIREEFEEAQERARSLVGEAEAKGREMQDKGREVVEGIREDVDNIRANVKDTAQKRKRSISKIFGG